MNSFLKTRTSGFSLLELFLVVATMALFALSVSTTLPEFRKRADLDSATEVSSSLLVEARAKTISSEKESQFGVHFQTDRVILFRGQTFSAIDPENVEKIFPNSIEINNISLFGGGNDIVFNRITGDTGQYGTISLNIREGSSASSTIVVGARGTVLIQ